MVVVNDGNDHDKYAKKWLNTLHEIFNTQVFATQMEERMDEQATDNWTNTTDCTNYLYSSVVINIMMVMMVTELMK